MLTPQLHLIPLSVTLVGTCTVAHPALPWFSILGDLLTTVGFFAVAVALVVLARRRTDLADDWRIPVAALILVVSGSTHLVQVWSLWNDTYFAGGFLSGITVAAALATVYTAWRIVATVFALPSQRALDEEVAKRRDADEVARRAQQLFEETQSLSNLAQERLVQSLADKELLLKEVHHRVKNNLQIICSLLRLQAGYIPEGPARTMFRNSEARVKCMALVHEKLYRSESLSRISFDSYVAELTRQLVRLRVTDPTKVNLVLDLDPVDLSIDKAVPSGLILNELVDNAIQHGIGIDGVLSLSVRLRREGERAEVVVADRGAGIAPEVDLSNPVSLGFRVVNTLCKQLSGELAVSCDGGAVIRLEFPLQPLEATREHTVNATQAIA